MYQVSSTELLRIHLSNVLIAALPQGKDIKPTRKVVDMSNSYLDVKIYAFLQVCIFDIQVSICDVEMYFGLWRSIYRHVIFSFSQMS